MRIGRHQKRAGITCYVHCIKTPYQAYQRCVECLSFFGYLSKENLKAKMLVLNNSGTKKKIMTANYNLACAYIFDGALWISAAQSAAGRKPKA